MVIQEKGGKKMSRKLKSSILLVIMLLGVVGLISGCSSSTGASQAQEEENYIPVAIEKATVNNIGNEIKINGKTFANEEIAVIPKVPGIVTNINVKLGDIVEKGTVLFTIEQEDISKSVEQAANGVELANKGVAQAENGFKTANVNYELNKEKIENAQLNLERTKKLYEEGAISKSQLEQAELAASDKSLEAIKGQVDQAQIGYEQALNQLRQAEISYEQVQSNLSNTVVTAPIGGVVSDLTVKEGQMASNAQPAATIAQMDKVYIQMNVVENMVNKLKLGQEVAVNVPAALDGEITSTISYISPTADPRSQLYPVKVYIHNQDSNIRPGMNGEVKLGLDQVESATVIKRNAVLDRDGKNLVYVVEGDKAVERVVTIGLDTGDYVEIKEGIKEGEQVIVEGQHYVEDGTKVKVVRGE